MYCLAKLDVGGYIYVLDEWQNSAGMFHRGYQSTDFPRAKWFKDKNDAKALIDRSDQFIMQFEEYGGCTKMWFSPEQHENGFLKRLDRWKGCYGRYPVARYNPLGVHA